MWRKFKHKFPLFTEQTTSVLIGSGTAVLAILVSLTGILQVPELIFLDLWFKLRPPETIDSRIVIVTIDEADITSLKQWPISDQDLAKLIEKIKQQKPSIIGLDIYRNLPVMTGYEELKKVFTSTPNLIGIEKLIAPSISPPPNLAEGQIGFSDIVVDQDGEVRRGLLFANLPNQPVKTSFATKVALKYLYRQGITPKLLNSKTQQIQLGKVIFEPLKLNNSGYINEDIGGYQILINFRGGKAIFPSIPITKVLNNQVPPGLFRDRIVLIGTTAESIPDNFKIPFSGAIGIIVHANLTSQIINAGLEGRPFIKPVQYTWIWIWIWSLIGATISLKFIRFSLCDQKISVYRLETSIFLQCICLLITHYLIFLNGFWIPIISSLLANFLATIVTTSHHNKKLRIQACFDELTQIFNRRHFDEFLQKQVSKKGNIALIFCDVDCFKIYNDTYGHQAGDRCLIQVAAAISAVILKFGVVARYGGEEFAIILPNTDLAKATQIAERIVQQVRSLNIPHINSTARSFVTISCGVVSMNISSTFLLSDLILKADKALYMAKNQGRDRFVAYTDLIGDR